MKSVLFILTISIMLNANNNKQDNVEILKTKINYLEKKISDQKTTYDLILQNQTILFTEQKDITSQAMTSSSSQMSYITLLVGSLGTLIIVIGAMFGWYISNGVYRAVDKKLRQEIATGQNKAYTIMEEKISKLNAKLDNHKTEIETKVENIESGTKWKANEW